MKVSMFCTLSEMHTTMPKLRGKAIHVKNLMPALLHSFKKRMDASPIHELVKQGLEASCKLDEILDAYPLADVLPPDAAKDFKDATWHYAQCQNGAASFYNTSQQGGQLSIFDVTIKTHQMMHGALRCGHLNPRKSYNYIGEDFMHKSKVLMESCVAGNSAASSTLKHMEKYCIALDLTLQQIEDDIFD